MRGKYLSLRPPRMTELQNAPLLLRSELFRRRCHGYCAHVSLLTGRRCWLICCVKQSLYWPHDSLMHDETYPKHTKCTILINTAPTFSTLTSNEFSSESTCANLYFSNLNIYCFYLFYFFTFFQTPKCALPRQRTWVRGRPHKRRGRRQWSTRSISSQTLMASLPARANIREKNEQRFRTFWK